MKLKLTSVTRGFIYLIFVCVMAVCAILVPELLREEAAGKPGIEPAYQFLIVAWILATPIFIALYETLRILNYIDQNKAFSEKSVTSVQKIKMCAIIFGAMIALGVTAMVVTARNVDPPEDVTGFVTLGFIFTFISSIIATFAAVLKRLLQNAVDMKLENDLIV